MVMAIMTLLGGSAIGAEFYVAPNGKDANPGTKAEPFATLVRARDAARKAGPGTAKRIIVEAGEYFDVSLVLEPQDSGLTIEAAPGGRPVLYGGRRVTNWRKDGDKFYAAELPGVKEGTWDFRTLVVDGKLRPRARMPRRGAFRHLNTSIVRWDRPRRCLWPKPTEAQLTTMSYREGDLGGWLEPRNAEITVYHNWDESYVGVKAIDTTKRIVTFVNRCSYPPGAYPHAPKARDYVVWNVRRGMHEAGQWYLDRKRGMVVYWPRPGEDIRKLNVIAPCCESIIRLAGQPKKPVREVTVKGLALRGTTTPLKSPGWAARVYAGALDAQWAGDCRFSDLSIESVGGHGIRIRNDRGTHVIGLDVRETGAGGIYLIDTVKARACDNRVAHVGRVYTSAVGICAVSHADSDWTPCQDNAVLHNEVFDTPYCGIEFGGIRNRIEKNLIHNVMKVLNDGAAIYGQGRGHTIRSNVARGLPHGRLVAAYYPDELNIDCLVEGNLAVDCSWPSHNHKSRNLTIRNNVFVNTKGDCRITTPAARGAILLEKNVICATGEIRVDPLSWKDNLVFSRQGAYAGVPKDVVKADPMFVAPAKGDYRFKPGSPAQKLGIKPLDIKDVGPRLDR